MDPKLIPPQTERPRADHLRRRSKRQLVEKDFAAALVKALKLARKSDAKSLPGWAGADPEE